MCRAIAYLGGEIQIADLLFNTSNSLVNQVLNAQSMNKFDPNLSGCGFFAWQQDAKALKPYHLYKSKNPPFFDKNLSNLARSIAGSSLLAHVRGAPLVADETWLESNVHPFYFPDAPFAMCHNGGIHFESPSVEQSIKLAMLKQISSRWSSYIIGTTDTELLYGLILTMFDTLKEKRLSRRVVKACQLALDQVQAIRDQYHSHCVSPLNLFITAPDMIITLRLTLSNGYYHHYISPREMIDYSLWYTLGHAFVRKDDDYVMQVPGKQTLICASEPLTRSSEFWFEVPDSTFVAAELMPDKQLDLSLMRY